MPPPIQQAGSRAALITWTVITSILFVVAAVLAIFAHVERNRLELEKTALKSQYSEFVSDTDLNSEIKTNLNAAKAERPELGEKLINVAISQRDELARKISGAATPADAMIAADAAIKQATMPEVKPSADTLVATISALTTELKAQEAQVNSLKAARAEINKRLDEMQANVKAQIEAKDKEAADARAQAAKNLEASQAYRSDKDKQVQEVQAAAEQQAKLAMEDLAKLQQQQTEATGRLRQLQGQIDALNARLRGLRLPVDQILKQADARVMRLAGNGILYIDLGSGDQVTPGMSFEVFDRLEGIPHPGDPSNDDNLPKGKASIEIIKVSPGSSECRIIRATPGQNVVEGDLCVNVVYDKNVHYNFLVYGNFDLDRNGQATPQDADVIKRLVTSWGGKPVDKLNVDVDFMVMGKVPELPNFSVEDLERPENAYALQQKKDELAAYEKVLGDAIQLNIPILNQNRFLYFVGYYEQSGR